MADVSLLDNGTVQNLRDAGCDEEFIKAYARITGEENINGILDLLSKHRGNLLHNIHKDQKRIDCLYYLIYKIKKWPK